MHRVTGRQSCGAVRFAWSCPVLFDRPPPRRRVLFPERTSRTKVLRQLWPRRPQALPVDPALFLVSGRTPMQAPWATAAWPGRNSPVPLRRIYSTPQLSAPTLNPQLSTRSHFGSFFALQKRPKFGTKRPVSAASTGGRSDHSGTLQGAISGTQTHSRRTGSKLGRLHRARQGLVRVPESNTKYGGKRGKTGVPSAPLPPPSISESSGIPKRKKLFGAFRFELRPAVHRATIYCRGGVASARLR